MGALLMMNQASIADILDLAAQTGIDAVRLVDALRLGSASSAALTLLNTMITPHTVDHLAEVQALDMKIFAEAMREASADPAEAEGDCTRAFRNPAPPGVIARLNPEEAR